MAILQEKIYSEKEFEEIEKENPSLKLEFLNGTIFNASTTSLNHNKIKRRIVSKLDTYFNNSKCDIYDEQIEVIVQDETETNKVKPDIFVVCNPYDTKGQSIVSAPLIVFEIISKSTAQHDRLVKYRIYEKFGIKEYNLVEQNGYIIQYKLDEDGIYKVNNTFKDNDTYSSCIFNDLKINLTDIYA